MALRLHRMTLRDVLANHGITRLKDFCERTGFTRQHGWNLMHGWTGVGKRTTQILHDKLGISFEELMQIRPVPRTARRKRQKPPLEDNV